MPVYVTLSLCAFLLVLLGTRLRIILLRKRTPPVDIGAMMGKRPAPIPNGGGIVVVFVLIIMLLAAGINYGVVLCMLLLAAISLLHDLIYIPFPVRLLVQVMAVTIPLSGLQVGFLGSFMPGWLDTLCTAVLWIGFINAFASMDNADGICAIEAISISTGLCLIAVFTGAFPSQLAIHGLITAAAVTGFLWWNWPPAKIRMGAAGCVPLAFLLGYLLLIAANSGYAFAALLLPAYVIAEGVITYSVKLFSPHKKSTSYYYQKARERGHQRNNIARYIVGANILLIFLAVRCTLDASLVMFNVASGYLCIFMLLGFFANHSALAHDPD